jgi:uncharacterized protein YfdQ (DUF2303 family)
MSDSILGLSAAIDSIAALGREPSVEVSKLPAEALPLGTTIASPHFLIITHGNGNVELKSVSPLIEEYRGKPQARHGLTSATSLLSFVALVERHKDSNSVIFANLNWLAPALVAVIDYHLAVTGDVPNGADDPYARFGRNRIVYNFPPSGVWDSWVGSNGKEMSQAEFAVLIESRIPDVANAVSDEWTEMESLLGVKFASPAELLGVSRGLKVQIKATSEEAYDPSSGATTMTFKNEVARLNNASVSVPAMFLIKVPVFEDGATVEIPVRLRHRTSDNGRNMWWYDLYRPEVYVRRLIDTAKAMVETTTNLPVYDGNPANNPYPTPLPAATGR